MHVAGIPCLQEEHPGLIDVSSDDELPVLVIHVPSEMGYRFLSFVINCTVLILYT